MKVCSLNMVRHAQCTMTCDSVQRLLNWMSGHRTWTSTVGNYFSGPAVLKSKVGQIIFKFLFSTNISSKFNLLHFFDHSTQYSKGSGLP